MLTNNSINKINSNFNIYTVFCVIKLRHKF